MTSTTGRRPARPSAATAPPVAVALQVKALTAQYERGRPVLVDIDLTVGVGESVALIGRNGCGKSTLLHCLSGSITPSAGSIELGPDSLVPLSQLSPRRRARRLGILHQSLPPIAGLTVRGLVTQGRYAHRHPLARFGDRESDEHVERALADVELLERADELLDTLSGGQRQRARLAVVLAQASPILLLDEPTAHLDVRHQLLLLDLVSRLRIERGLTVVTVLHDLDQVARCAERVVALQEGRVVADGPVAEVITPELLRNVFGVVGRLLPGNPWPPRVLIDAPA
ncbi:MAG: ABC transporter ATP-binding protein [Nakamurella sp.]